MAGALTTPDYAFELWDINGVFIADVSKYARNRHILLKLNDADRVTFDIDLNSFEEYCTSIGAHPRNILSPGRTELKVRRNGSYLTGTQVIRVQPQLTKGYQKLSVTADGYENYFLQRYIKKTYTATDRSQIAWDAINTTQTQANGSFGITQGTLAVTTNSDRICDYDEVKDILTDYTWYQGGANYDFEITPDKVFNTYLSKGSDKPNIELVYGQNIVSITDDIDASTIANRIIGLGSGIGADRKESIAASTTSQAKYRVREKKSLFNSVSDQTTLDANTYGVLSEYNEAVEIPVIKVTGDVIDVGTTIVGDAVTVRIDGYKYLDNINGLFRINQIGIDLDETNAELVSVNFYDPRNGGALNGS